MDEKSSDYTKKLYDETLNGIQQGLNYMSYAGRVDISHARMVEMYQRAARNLEAAKKLAKNYAYLNPDIARLTLLQHELAGWRIKIGLDKTSAEIELDMWAEKLGLDFGQKK